MFPLILAALLAPAQADVVMPPPNGEIHIRHRLRVEGMEQHPEMVLLLLDPGDPISGWRAFEATGNAQQEIAAGAGKDQDGMDSPNFFAMPTAAYSTWKAAADAETLTQRAACADRGEGCAHISRFVPSIARPTPLLDCGLSISPKRTAPTGSPAVQTDRIKILDLSPQACRLELGQSPPPSHAPADASAQAGATSPTERGCETATSLASGLGGLLLLAGLSARRRRVGAAQL